MNMKLETMINIKTPRIDKTRMMGVIENTRRNTWHQIKKEPEIYFFKLRNNMIRNKTHYTNEAKIDHKIDSV